MVSYGNAGGYVEFRIKLFSQLNFKLLESVKKTAPNDAIFNEI